MPRNPLFVALLPIWLTKGKAYLKEQIATRSELDVKLLPYNEPLLDYLRSEWAQWRWIALATASNERLARRVAEHLGLFDEIVASDGQTNLSGERKRERLVALYGERGFCYVANERVDVPVWASASEAVLVDASPSVEARARAVARVTRVVSSPRPGLRQYLKAIRAHQWLKNVLVFVPLLLAHQWGDFGLIVQASLAFLAFGLCASSVYVLNDLLDLDAGRQHPRKKRRAFAAGTIPRKHGLMLVPTLLSLAVAVALMLPAAFLAALALYYATTLAYSLRLKKVVLVDVLTLAGLYTLRILAGGAATGITTSFWLLALSMFLFLSLALVKRYSELLVVQAAQRESAAGRGYELVDLETLAHFGIASGYAAVLVFALYINSETVGALYRRPEALWLVCPLFLYWIGRVWLLARRNQMHEDPVIFAIEDRQSHWLVAVVAAIAWAAA